MAKSTMEQNVDAVKAVALKEIDKSRKMVAAESAKMKKSIEGAMKKAEEFMRKNPEKATAVAAGVGAALGAALAMLVTGGGSKKGKK
jgi:ElaB/YqjD/DUF883 family membrane-anchored ribosome-binding protein